MRKRPRSRSRTAGLGASLAETFLGWKLTGIDGKLYSPFAESKLRLRDLVDGFLYLGSLSTYTRSPFDSRPVDEADRAELRRRVEIWGDQELFQNAIAALAL